MSGDEKSRVEALKELLDYPIALRDRSGSRFWFLRPGESHSAAEETQPIAVGFYDELNSKGDRDLKAFLTSPEQQQEIYGHYVDRVNEDQPVMYILLPRVEETGRVALVLPTEGKLRIRQIQTFEWNSPQLLNSRLPRLHKDSLPIADKALVSTPLVEWVFYDSVATAKELAQRLAEVTRQIEQVIPDVYATESSNGYLHQLLTSFQKELLPNLKVSSTDEKEYSFADIYAQTVAYGLFTARVFSYERNKDDLQTTEFNRLTAWKLLPETNPFLRRLFQDISERSPLELGDELIEAIVEIISYLRVAKMKVILRDFHQKINQEDIVIRFYEDFLAAYKPKMRERRGVYYTPEPVVSYMVRSVDGLLKDKFNKPLGIADPEVMILDPACGTGTFLLWIFQLIYKRFQESPDALTEGLEDKSWSGYVKERLLPRVFGFELLMAPYAIAHLKLGLFLEETGYQFDSGKRLKVFLTNALDDSVKKAEVLFEEFIAEEANQATEVKRDLPIMVVVGNPPYSVNSANNSNWATNLIRDSYYPKDAIKEQNPKLLLDDYVKFIRFAQHRIEQTGYGILGFISNHGYLDNPTFRAMRQSLMRTFDCIHALDLHGNIKKKEKTPDGSKDENVFDIQQGVAISLFTKLSDNTTTSSQINHSNLWGNRKYKYDWLISQSLATSQWNKLSPQLPFSLLIPQNNELLPEYNNYYKITDIMPVNSTGVKTHRDHFVIDFEQEKLKERISNFRNLQISDLEIANSYELKDTGDWKINPKRKSLAANLDWQTAFTKCLYRPFDTRHYYHHSDVVDRPRHEVMQHMLAGDNLGLICSRQQSQSVTWSLVGISRDIVECCAISNKTKETNYIFPLYLYPTTETERQMGMKRSINFSQNFLNDIKSKLRYIPTPEAILYYIYAVLHSPTYRDRYAEFLKIDFPRIPLTSNDLLFRQLSDYGEQLVQLHLMTSPKLDNLITEFVEGTGELIVAPGHPKYQNGAVHINKNGDKFKGVPEEVWNFYVGGYQPCQKWLKDRKERTLSDEDILHYQKMVVALKETIELMVKIDAAIPSFPIQ
ncbi:DNA methyltransferase [Pleurocapsa sp. CCALA 161]|uniref:type ISP restriction/modification enzyme n=1 Tax=Pleurocapsa sp. CCALA 161 TaxID=2107688 RepID=UPI000D083F23|nr:DNA methyltransferase [Pleurocapsa sp. CCALA 161]